MFKIETENLILRDMVEADIEKHMRCSLLKKSGGTGMLLTGIFWN